MSDCPHHFFMLRTWLRYDYLVKCVTNSMSALGVNSLLSRLLNLYVFYICRVPQTAGKVQVVHSIMFVFKQHHYGCFSLGVTL